MTEYSQYLKNNCPYKGDFMGHIYFHTALEYIPYLILVSHYLNSLGKSLTFDPGSCIYLYLIYITLFSNKNVNISNYPENKNNLFVTDNKENSSSDIDYFYIDKFPENDKVSCGSDSKLYYPEYICEPIERCIIIALKTLSFLTFSNLDFKQIKNYKKQFSSPNVLSKYKKKDYITPKIDLSSYIDNLLSGLIFNSYLDNPEAGYENIPVFVINLEREKERKKSTFKILTDLGFKNITFVIPFPATDETVNKVREYIGFSKDRFIYKTKASLMMTFFSLLDMDDADNMIICEDDIRLINNISDSKVILNYSIRNVPKECDMLKFELCMCKDCDVRLNFFNVVKKHLCNGCTYFPSIDKRRKILKNFRQNVTLFEKSLSEHIAVAADSFVYYLCKNDLCTSMYHKLLFSQNLKKFGSTLEGSGKTKHYFARGKPNNKFKLLPKKYSGKLTTQQTKSSSFKIYLIVIISLIIVCIMLLLFLRMR